jgi:hypothetical protein
MISNGTQSAQAGRERRQKAEKADRVRAMSLLRRTTEPRLPSGSDRPNRQQDFYAWLLDQARTLRVDQPVNVDWSGLAEELEEMAIRVRHELLSHLEELFAHLLKLRYEPSENV